MLKKADQVPEDILGKITVAVSSEPRHRRDNHAVLLHFFSGFKFCIGFILQVLKGLSYLRDNHKIIHRGGSPKMYYYCCCSEMFLL